jgi:hypothetical protein
VIANLRLFQSEINPTFSVVIHSTTESGIGARPGRQRQELALDGKQPCLSGLGDVIIWSEFQGIEIELIGPPPEAAEVIA